MILAGDIGGTNTRLAVFDDRLRIKHSLVFKSNDFGSLDEPVAKFLAGAGVRVDRACFGVAGPVVRGTAKVTNLKWVVDTRSLARGLRVRETRLRLINDLQANASGIPLLQSKDVMTLNAGVRKEGNRAIISAGTGLGEAGLYWDGRAHHPVASEGGHASYGPTSELEDRLLVYLRARERARFGGHVSWERVLSGNGLTNIFKFLTHERIGRANVDVMGAIAGKDAPRTISAAALNGTCDRSDRALDLFARAYGCEAGNLALKFLAVGGLYVGGGIAPKIIGRLKNRSFMSAFCEKGPMKKLLETIPVHVILNDKTALIGAARVASEIT